MCPVGNVRLSVCKVRKRVGNVRVSVCKVRAIHRREGRNRSKRGLAKLLTDSWPSPSVHYTPAGGGSSASAWSRWVITSSGPPCPASSRSSYSGKSLDRKSVVEGKSGDL